MKLGLIVTILIVGLYSSEAKMIPIRLNQFNFTLYVPTDAPHILQQVKCELIDKFPLTWDKFNLYQEIIYAKYYCQSYEPSLMIQSLSLYPVAISPYNYSGIGITSGYDLFLTPYTYLFSQETYYTAVNAEQWYDSELYFDINSQIIGYPPINGTTIILYPNILRVYQNY